MTISKASLVYLVLPFSFAPPLVSEKTFGG